MAIDDEIHEDGRDWITDAIMKSGGAIEFFSARFPAPVIPEKPEKQEPEDVYDFGGYDFSHLKPDQDDEDHERRYLLP